jgi:hypothetical protein
MPPSHVLVSSQLPKVAWPQPAKAAAPAADPMPMPKVTKWRARISSSLQFP